MEIRAELDEPQCTSDRETSMDSMTMDRQTANLVAEALNQVAIGEYEFCHECEEPIGRRRHAISWAKFCIRCQEQAGEKHLHEFAQPA